MKISIVGTGYVGLVTGISLAKLGHKVVCIEQDPNKVSRINSGKSPFFEPEVFDHLKNVHSKGLLIATNELEKALGDSDITFIAVGTPTIKKKIDLSFIKKASKQIGKALRGKNKYHTVVVKSTVLPGVTNGIVKPLIELHSGKKIGEFGLCMNPEFLREGNAMQDALNPDRIIIGQIDEKSGRELAKVYKKVSVPRIFTNLQTAEMIKYAANALLTTLISYSNEIASISEGIDGVDVVDIWKGVHLDRRLSPNIGDIRLKPGILNYIMSGCGFGGSCFSKDMKALLNFANKMGIDAKLIKAVLDINISQPHRVISLLKDALGNNLKNKKIAILGLSFKPNTDDIRESPALPVIEELILEGAKIFCHDPMVYKNHIPEQLTNISGSLAGSVREAIEGADAVLIITSWKEYVKLPSHFFKKYMKHPIVIDGRRIFDRDSFMSAGILYKGIGL